MNHAREDPALLLCYMTYVLSLVVVMVVSCQKPQVVQAYRSRVDTERPSSTCYYLYYHCCCIWYEKIASRMIVEGVLIVGGLLDLYGRVHLLLEVIVVSCREIIVPYLRTCALDGSFFFSSHFYFPASGRAVVTGVVPSSPRFLPSIFIAHSLDLLRKSLERLLLAIIFVALRLQK